MPGAGPRASASATALGNGFWEPMLDFFQKSLVAEGTISPADIDLLRVTDSIDEAMVHVKASPFCGR